MIKVCISNKSNDVSRFNIFKRFFECINSNISLTCCTKTGAVYQYQYQQILVRRIVI